MRLVITMFMTTTFSSAAVAFGQIDQSTDEHELTESRATALRAMVDEVLNDADLRAYEFETDPAHTDLEWERIDLGALQDQADKLDALDDEVESAAAVRHDHDGDGVVDDGDLARAAQNPIADLISLPFQNNLNIDVGKFNYEQNVLNIQPVIPFNLNDDWNLITRTIIPVIYQPAMFSGDEHDFGISDIQFTAFLSPKKPVNGWVVGAGPVVQLPTSTDKRLGARKWTAGPSAVALRIDGPWVYGMLAQNVWSFAGSGDSNVNAMLIQPFVNYNMDDGWYLTSSPIITSNWEAKSDDQWVVPVGGGFGRVFRLGDQPINCSLQAFHNVETPSFGPEWTIRFQLQFLFPR